MTARRKSEKIYPIQFTNRVPRSEAALKHRVVRVTPRGGLKLTILSSDMIGHQVHYYKRAGLPCYLNPCPACMKQIRRQWEGYMWVRSIRTREIALACVPPTGALALEGLFDQFKTLTGLQVHLFRVPDEATGRVAVRVLGHDPEERLPPGMARVEDFLAMMWKLPVQLENPAFNDPLGRMTTTQRAAAEEDLRRKGAPLREFSENGHGH